MYKSVQQRTAVVAEGRARVGVYTKSVLRTCVLKYMYFTVRCRLITELHSVHQNCTVYNEEFSSNSTYTNVSPFYEYIKKLP